MAENTAQQYADALNSVDIFRGTDKGYELDRLPTRAEGLTLLIRLLGKESEALASVAEHPFTDSDGWAEPYIAYAFKNGITKGISPTEFGPNLNMTHQQFSTLLLRAMGYSDDKGGQFVYDTAYEFALHKFAIDNISSVFNRGELARLSYAALNTTLYNSNKTLAQTLISKRVFTQSEFTAATSYVDKRDIKTAVLIYAVASDLESKLGMLSMDINEIIGSDAKGIEILMQTGGTKNYRNTSLTDEKTQRLKLTDGKLENLGVIDNAPMCELETLSDFLRYAKENVVADRFVLVFWDHGDGTVGGFGRDELANNKSLSLADLKSAVGAFGQKLDMIVFDACLMGTAECAYALKDCAEYMIASEDLTPTDGLYYTTWLHSLSVNPRLSNEALARMIVDAFIVHSPQGREDVMMSVIRLSNAEQLLNTVVAELEEVKNATNGFTYFDIKNLSPYGEGEGNDQYDLISVFKTADADTSRLGVAIEFAIYYKRSVVENKYCGVAIYLPTSRRDDYEVARKSLIKLDLPPQHIPILDLLNTVNKQETN